MNILVACEFSGRVRDAFKEQGHYALSCDLRFSEKPGQHYKGDVKDILYDGWDMLIGFPPCTYLCLSGIQHINTPEKMLLQSEAIEFVQMLWNSPIKYIALENPKGVLSTRFMRPSQIIYPSWFGHNEKKGTCLWLKNLPPLMATCIETGNLKNEVHNMTRKNRSENRSRTYTGIASAMAIQWSNL